MRSSVIEFPKVGEQLTEWRVTLHLVVVLVAKAPRVRRFWGAVSTNRTPPALFFFFFMFSLVETSLRAPIPLFRQSTVAQRAETTVDKSPPTSLLIRSHTLPLTTHSPYLSKIYSDCTKDCLPLCNHMDKKKNQVHVFGHPLKSSV